MSSTPLFDAIARRGDEQAARATTVTASAPAPVPAPASPMTAPAADRDPAVPADLVAAIDEIPARMRTAVGTDHLVGAEQLALVEAVTDAVVRAVVDAAVAELERIARDGVVRG